jgi:hypothetical protein
MKKIVAALVMVVIAFGSAQIIGASEDSPRIRVSGEFLEFPGGQPPVIMEQRTLVPLRDVMEYLGFEVEWDASTELVELRKPAFIVFVTINNYTMTVNGRQVGLSAAPRLISGRTMVPVRAISEATGLDVVWDGVNGIVDIWTAGAMPAIPDAPINTPGLQATKSSINLPRDGVLTDSEFSAWRAEYMVLGGANVHEIDIVNRINAERIRRGIHPLEMNIELMEAGRFGAHAWAEAVPYNFWPSEEKKDGPFRMIGFLSMGAGRTSRDQVGRYMSEQLTRDRILGYRYNKVGVGAHIRDDGTYSWNLMFSE